MSVVEVEWLRVGPPELRSVVYVLWDPRTRDAALVDPGWEAPTLLEALRRKALRLRAVLLTHGHSDHVGAVAEIVRDAPAPVYMSDLELASRAFRAEGLRAFADDERLEAGSLRIDCLLTPGHTPGSACFLCADALFTGDTLFMEGCGRCDGPGGSSRALFRSIQRLKARLDPGVRVFPGHVYGSDPGAPISRLSKTNLYLALADEDAFVRFCDRRSR